ncbi:unnamed protein product, partial [Rotaria socialis]
VLNSIPFIMKTKIVILVLILTFSLIFIIDAREQKHRPKNALRAQVLDYLEREMQRRRENSMFDDDEDEDDDNYNYNDDDDNDDDDDEGDNSYGRKRQFARRKVVGLGDEPF